MRSYASTSATEDETRHSATLAPVAMPPPGGDDAVVTAQQGAPRRGWTWALYPICFVLGGAIAALAFADVQPSSSLSVGARPAAPAQRAPAAMQHRASGVATPQPRLTVVQLPAITIVGELPAARESRRRTDGSLFDAPAPASETESAWQ